MEPRKRLDLPPAVAKAFVRDIRVTITLSVYRHLFPQTDDRAAQIMEAAFTAPETAK